MANIGLGCVTFGREIDKSSAFSIMDYAVEKEIYSWDTAAVYGNGASEMIIGEWLRNNPSNSDVAISTKILPPYEAPQLEGRLSESLSRLQRGSTEILYLHNWDESAVGRDVLQKLDDFISRGLIKGFGLSNFNGQQLKRVLSCCEQFGLQKPAVMQNNHNFAVSAISEEMIRLCEANRIRIVTYSPLGAGFLTGKHSSGIASGSRFDVMPAHQQIYFTRASVYRLNGLLTVARQTGETPATLALVWALNQSFVSTVLIGAREKRHIDQALQAMAVEEEVKAGWLERLYSFTVREKPLPS